LAVTAEEAWRDLAAISSPAARVQLTFLFNLFFVHLNAGRPTLVGRVQVKRVY
jgi:hypothetical protein